MCFSLHVTVFVLTISVRCQIDVVSTPGSPTCATAFKLLVPYLAAFLSYVKSIPTLVTTICREHASYPADPVCRPTPNVAGESPSSTVELVLMPSQMKNSEVSITPTHCWMSLSPGWKCWTCVGWDGGVLLSSSASAAFRRQHICNGLIEIPCKCGLSPWTTFTHVPLAHEANMFSSD